MAENNVNGILRGQRDAALDLATEQTVKSIDARRARNAALGIAAVTEVERDAALAERNHVIADRDAAIDQRNAAQTIAAVEREEAASNATGFYMLLTAVIVALVIVACVYLMRTNKPTPNSTTIQRITPITAPPTPRDTVVLPSSPPAAVTLPAPSAPITTTPQTVTKFVPVPTPAPAQPPTTIIVTPPAPSPSNAGTSNSAPASDNGGTNSSSPTDNVPAAPANTGG